MYVKFVPCSILVGAPNESGTNGTRTGAVYQCELGNGDNNCSRVVPFDSYTGDANTACIKICAVRICRNGLDCKMNVL